MANKTCITCTKVFPSTSEYYHSDGKGGLRADCKWCRSARRKGYYIQIEEVKPQKKLKKTKIYIITYAQNATPVHNKFLASIKQFAEYNDAQIVVIAGRYRNPTSIWTQDLVHEDWWADAVNPYIFGGIHSPNQNLSIFGNISIQPTAVRPLSGFEGHIEHQSGIFGHPKQELRTIATDKRAWPRILTTTGACTVPNYTDSKAGKKGEKRHTLGAVVAEICGKRFYLRHVTAGEDGSFQDLDKLYTPKGVEEEQTAEALICGDIHAAFPDNGVNNATFFDPDSVVNTLKPKHIVYHDVLSMHARPKYDWNDLRTRYERHFGEHNSVQEEIEQAILYICDATPPFSQGYVVQSNHDDHLMEWLNNAKWKDDPENALLYHKLWYILLEYWHTNDTRQWISPMKLWYNQVMGEDRIKFLNKDETLVLAGHACSFHGHDGVNGTRGSISQFSKLGVKTVIGHSHSPGIQDHCVQVGITASLDHGYNSLPSSWFHAHGLIYPDGSRTLIFIVDGKWKV